MNSRLVFIEGLSGAGKTTTVEALKHSKIAQIGTKVEFYNEHDNPLNSFWTWGDGAIENEVIEAPYDSQRFIRRILKKTSALVDTVRSGDLCVVMEGYPFHLTIGNMLKMLGTRDDCRDYYRRFVDAIRPCCPYLIFLEQPDWLDRIAKLAEERGVRFKEHLSAFKRTPYGRKFGVRDDSEVLNFHMECHRFARSLANDWPYELDSFNALALGKLGTVRRIEQRLISHN